MLAWGELIYDIIAGVSGNAAFSRKESYLNGVKDSLYEGIFIRSSMVCHRRPFHIVGKLLGLPYHI